MNLKLITLIITDLTFFLNNLGISLDDSKKLKRGNTLLDSSIKAVNFALVFGCPPSIGVKSDTKMLFDISFALIEGVAAHDMACTFPNVLETLQGTDTNLELVTSTTLMPLKIFYEHNVVRILRGYIFVQEGLEGVGKFKGYEKVDQRAFGIGDNFLALELGKRIEEDMKDPESTNISDVKLFVNLTKDETI